MEQFILFRGLQGLGGGAIFPIALAVVADLYTPAERGKYLGSFGAVFGLSSLIGPGLGGFITDTFGWHWIFFINIPIGLISLFILWRLLPAIRRPDAGQNIDYLGAAVFTGAVAPFLIGLSNKQGHDWTDPVVGGLMLLGLVLGAVFLFVETRAADPIVPLGLFRLRTFSISVAATFFVGFAFLDRGHLPAALVPDGRRSERDRVRLQPPAAARRPDLQRGGLRPDRRPGRSLQVADVRLAGAARGLALPDDEPHAEHGPADPLAVDVPRRASASGRPSPSSR